MFSVEEVVDILMIMTFIVIAHAIKMRMGEVRKTQMPVQMAAWLPGSHFFFL